MPEGQAGAGIQVTPEMMSRGASEISTYDPDYEAPDDGLRRILIAMFGREAVGFHEGH